MIQRDAEYLGYAHVRPFPFASSSYFYLEYVNLNFRIFLITPPFKISILTLARNSNYQGGLGVFIIIYEDRYYEEDTMSRNTCYAYAPSAYAIYRVIVL